MRARASERCADPPLSLRRTLRRSSRPPALPRSARAWSGGTQRRSERPVLAPSPSGQPQPPPLAPEVARLRQQRARARPDRPRPRWRSRAAAPKRRQLTMIIISQRGRLGERSRSEPRSPARTAGAGLLCPRAGERSPSHASPRMRGRAGSLAPDCRAGRAEASWRASLPSRSAVKWYRLLRRSQRRGWPRRSRSCRQRWLQALSRRCSRSPSMACTSRSRAVGLHARPPVLAPPAL